MPAKDLYHDTVRIALEKEGWIITHDPYFVRLGKRRGFIDLGAEMIGAERGIEKIAVESDRRCGKEFLWFLGSR